MTVQRMEPPLAAGGREMLAAWLQFHRDTLAVKCEGLTGSYSLKSSSEHTGNGKR